MSHLFKKRNTYYLCVKYKGKRVRRSLGTSNIDIAKKIANELEESLLHELVIGKTPQRFSNKDIDLLMHEFMSFEHNWKPRTREIYETCFKHYLNKGFPENPSYKAMVIRCLNRLQNWACNEGIIEKARLIPGGNKYEPRTRVFNEEELELIMHKCTPYHYQQFVRFAYYTGARQGEIRNLVENNIYHEHLEIDGKTGKRIIKLNTQAQEVLQKQHVLWSYCRRYVNHTFKKNVRKMYIKNARFHDLRRTFGYNLIKSEMPIYQVSKLLGHKSVTTTEKHYAPLMVKDIPNFEL